METVQLVRGCRLKPIRAELFANGAPRDLSASTFTFRMVSATDVTAVKVAAGACVIEDAVGGVVRYDPAAADVDTAGEYYGWFVEMQNSKTDRWPKDTELLIRILPDY